MKNILRIFLQMWMLILVIGSANALVGDGALATAQPQLKFFNQFGNADHQALGHSIATDKDGNIYIAGTTSYPVDPSMSHTIGEVDWFILKMSPDGENVLWAREFGQSNTSVMGVQLLVKDQQVFVSTVRAQADEMLCTLASFDNQGRPVWSQELGNDLINALAYDETEHNLIVMGSVGGSPKPAWFMTQFGPEGQQLFKQVYTGLENGAYQPYAIAKLANGNMIAMVSNVDASQKKIIPYYYLLSPTGQILANPEFKLKGYTAVFPSQVIVTPHDEVIVAGTAELPRKAFHFTYFVAKFKLSELSLLPVWAKAGSVNAKGGVNSNSLVYNPTSGSIFLGGNTFIGLNSQAQIGVIDYFAVKYDQNGNLQWTAQAGAANGTASINGLSVATSDDRLWFTGYTTHGLHNLPQEGTVDVIVGVYQ